MDDIAAMHPSTGFEQYTEASPCVDDGLSEQNGEIA
jgi:hypothetical protein